MILLCPLIGGNPAFAADVHALLIDAQQRFQQDRFEQALTLYQQAHEAEPGHAAVEYNIALCHLRLGDGEKATRHFESVASGGDVTAALRGDAFYNLGLMRAQAARTQLRDLLAPATQPSDSKPAPDDPANLATLQAVADELLRSISSFRKSAEVKPDPDTEHNIRAARIMRRDVLGLLRRAAEAKQKEDMLKDPRAYLETLIREQDRQVSLGRLLALQPPEDAGASREARRAGLRAQRKLMEETGTFADHLSQFRESVPDSGTPAATSAPAGEPASETPREKVYRAAARQLGAALDAQKQACAHLLDNEIEPAHEKQASARDAMYKSLYLFPLDPAQALVKTRWEQAHLRALVDAATAPEDWLRDPLLPEAPVPANVAWNADQAPLHQAQGRLGVALAMLHRQCEHVATSTRPAEEPPAGPEQQDPMLDPELNGKLAEVLVAAGEPQQRCLSGIAARERRDVLAAQDELLKLIEAALALLPKTLEQRIAELITRQDRLNAEVQAETGGPPASGSSPAGAAIDEVRKWAAQFKSRLLGRRPGRLAEAFIASQEAIRGDTQAVNEDVRKQIPPGAAAPAPATSQPSELNAHIEAAKHLADADRHMQAAMKGLEQVLVENSIKPMEAGGTVQTGQLNALASLVNALKALRPPASQPNQDQENQQQQPQRQPQRSEQDRQREVERLDRERERAERELHQRRPRTVIKDW